MKSNQELCQNVGSAGGSVLEGVVRLLVESLEEERTKISLWAVLWETLWFLNASVVFSCISLVSNLFFSFSLPIPLLFYPVWRHVYSQASYVTLHSRGGGRKTPLSQHCAGLQQISLAGKPDLQHEHSFVLLQLHRALVSLCSTVPCRGAGQDISSQFKRVKVRHIIFSPFVGIGKKRALQTSYSPVSSIYFSIGSWYPSCCINCRGRPND